MLLIDNTWYGLSTETKPTADPAGRLPTLPAGYVFVEEDTGASYYWSGSAWVAKPAAVLGSVTLGGALPAGTAVIGSTKDAGPSWTTVWGVGGVPFTSADATAVVSVTDAPTSGQKLVITDLIISTAVAMTVTLKCETTGAVIAGPFYLPAASGPCQLTPRSKGWKLGTADKKLQVITSATGGVMIHAAYFSEP